jgi:hypothetical protein
MMTLTAVAHLCGIATGEFPTGNILADDVAAADRPGARPACAEGVIGYRQTMTDECPPSN